MGEGTGGELVRRWEAIGEDLQSSNSELRSPVFSETEPRMTQGDADGGGEGSWSADEKGWEGIRSCGDGEGTMAKIGRRTSDVELRSPNPCTTEPPKHRSPVSPSVCSVPSCSTLSPLCPLRALCETPICDLLRNRTADSTRRRGWGRGGE